MAFPNFFGKQYESASNFLDDLEMAFLVSRRDEEEVKLRAFPLVLKDSAKNWFQNLEPGRKTNWETVKETFLSKYGGLDNPEHLWHRISSLHQATSRTYLTYESQFLRLWAEWEASLAEGERAPNFLKKEKFLAGLFPDLQEKVKGKFPKTFEEALQIARVKDRKLEYQAHTSRVEHPQGPTMADERLPPAPTTTPEDPHLELLQRVTNQLDNLSINMVQGVRQQQPQPNNERMPNCPRRQPQRRDYFCYNCGEEGHGMYFCPHPRNFNAQAGRGRQQVTPPRARPPPQIQPQILQNPQMVAQPQVLQRSEAPQPVAEIPPLPNNNGIVVELLWEMKFLEMRRLLEKEEQVETWEKEELLEMQEKEDQLETTGGHQRVGADLRNRVGNAYVEERLAEDLPCGCGGLVFWKYGCMVASSLRTGKQSVGSGRTSWRPQVVINEWVLICAVEWAMPMSKRGWLLMSSQLASGFFYCGWNAGTMVRGSIVGVVEVARQDFGSGREICCSPLTFYSGRVCMLGIMLWRCDLSSVCCFAAALASAVLVGSCWCSLAYVVPKLKKEARAVADSRRWKRCREREDGDGPGRVIEANVTVSIGSGDVDVGLLPCMEEFLRKETCAGLCAVERGGIAFNLHFQMVVHMWVASLKSINKKVRQYLGWDTDKPVGALILCRALKQKNMHTFRGIVGATMDEGSESIGVEATQEENLAANGNNCPFARLQDLLCDISVQLQADNPVEQRPLRFEMASRFDQLRSVLENVTIDDLAMQIALLEMHLQNLSKEVGVFKVQLNKLAALLQRLPVIISRIMI
ncbi:hypothetical protein L7F22_054590 [Adiantum nelumboides]|nr:hypothetical protein [Adiantum nelumboides]